MMPPFAKITLIILFSFLIGSSVNLNAQEFGSNVKQEGKVTLQTEQQGFKPNVRVSLGTSFSSFGAGFNSFGTYVAPEISIPINNKFSVEVGMGYSSLFYSTPGETMFSGNNAQYGSIYVSGTYYVNEKLTIRGTGYKTFLLNPENFNGEANNSFYDYSNQGVRLDMDYKVTDKFRIGLSIEYREQNYPSFYPYEPNGINGFGGLPFNSNPAFHSGF